MEIYHPVARIGPDYGEIASGHHILDAERIVGRSDGEQYPHILVFAWRWAPLVEFACGNDEYFRQCARHGMVGHVTPHLCRLWGPVVAEKFSASEKFVQPGPSGVGIIECSRMKPDPPSAVFHVFTEIVAPFFRWLCVEHDHGRVFFQSFIRIIVKTFSDIIEKALAI